MNGATHFAAAEYDQQTKDDQDDDDRQQPEFLPLFKRATNLLKMSCYCFRV